MNYQSDGTLVWTDNGSVHNFNPTFRNQTESLDLAEFKMAGRNFVKISKVNDGWLLLDDSGELNYASREFQSIASKVSNFEVAPNGNRIAVTNDNGLFIYDLDAEEKFIGMGQKIDQLSWYEDVAHVIVLEGGNIYFKDISEGTPVDSYKLADGVSKFKYDAKGKKVFFSRNDGIWEIKL